MANRVCTPVETCTPLQFRMLNPGELFRFLHTTNKSNIYIKTDLNHMVLLKNGMDFNSETQWDGRYLERIPVATIEAEK